MAVKRLYTTSENLKEMNDTLINDSIKVINTALASKLEKGESINLWMWIAVAEFLIIIYLIINDRLNSKNKEKLRFKNESLGKDIDFDNIINSSFNSTKLYDELKVKCHPDRFPIDDEKNIIADEIFQEITKNKTNIKRLIELKEEAEKKLDINFKNK